MKDAFHAIWEMKERHQIPMRTAAFVVAIGRVAQAMKDRGNKFFYTSPSRTFEFRKVRDGLMNPFVRISPSILSCFSALPPFDGHGRSSSASGCHRDYCRYRGILTTSPTHV